MAPNRPTHLRSLTKPPDGVLEQREPATIVGTTVFRASIVALGLTAVTFGMFLALILFLAGGR